MNNKAKIAMVSAVSAIALSGVLIAQRTYAQGTPMNDLVSKIATKFNVKQEDVQQVFDDFKAEKRTEMTTRFTTRLDQAVTDGSITAEQKDLIITKEKEVSTKMEEIRTLDDKDKERTAMNSLISDLKKWADDNKIDTKWLHPLGEPRGRAGFDGPGGPGMRGGHMRMDMN